MTILAENELGAQRAAYSQFIWVDHTPPSPGHVIEVPDTVVLNTSDPNGDDKCDQGLGMLFLPVVSVVKTIVSTSHHRTQVL